MKTKLTFIFLIVYIAQIAHSQTNWFPTGAKWHYSFSAPYGIGYTKLEVLDGDTIIESQSCKRMFSTTITKGFSSKLDTATEMLYVREEGRIVRDGKGRQMYNFNAVVGDTLDTTFGDSFVVDSIGLIEINGLSLAFQDVKFPDPFDPGEYYTIRLVEKIGSIHSHLFLNKLIIKAADFPVYNFRCYEDGELGLINFRNDEVDCDHIEGQLKEYEFPILSGNIFPNPAAEYFIIDDKSFGIWDNGVIYNSIGQKVMAFKNTGNNSQVEIENLTKGVYFVVLNKSGKKLFVQKLIKN